ncbi:hypothetical protein [Microbispora sp. NPDC049125]|uniref:hypothetical protein n=1 Tax=Microbispora sp. NPDC049125 TaxID=3154929 RepID=UPI003466A1F3
MTMSTTPWLASACPDALGTQVKLRHEAARAQALLTLAQGPAVFGVLADVASHRIPAYVPAFTGRPMGDEQTDRRTANDGAKGPHYAWREPVTQ